MTVFATETSMVTLLHVSVVHVPLRDTSLSEEITSNFNRAQFALSLYLGKGNSSTYFVVDYGK